MFIELDDDEMGFCVLLVSPHSLVACCSASVTLLNLISGNVNCHSAQERFHYKLHQGHLLARAFHERI